MSDLCVVTGGAGFIGCAISSYLADKFDRVIAVDNLHPQIHANRKVPTALDPRVDLIEADVASESTWDDLLRDERPRVVIHLAAETGTGQSLTEGSRHAYVNVFGLTQMLDAMVRHEVRPERIVLASSRAVYGEGAWQRPDGGDLQYPGQRTHAMLEQGLWDFEGLKCLPFYAPTTQTRPTSIYGATKLAQENILQAWGLSYGVEIPILRFQNVYGPGQSLTNSYTGIVSLFVKIAREGKAIPIYEDGNIVRDFVFIDDVAKAIVRVSCGASISTVPYDVGSGVATSILQLGQVIAAMHQAPAPQINGLFRNGDVRHACCDLSRTLQDLSWSPAVSLDDGLKALCQWIDTQG